MGKLYISEHYTTDDFPLPHSFETKLTLFYDRWIGWKFEVADRFLNGYTVKEDGKERAIPAVPGSAYAALDVICSYFEPIAKYSEGYCDPNDDFKSGHYFKKGAKWVFIELNTHPNASEVETVLTILWRDLRCGLYHTGAAKGHIGLTGGIADPIHVSFNPPFMMINPHKLIPVLVNHLNGYIASVRSQGEGSDLGRSFLKRYDYDNS